MEIKSLYIDLEFIDTKKHDNERGGKTYDIVETGREEAQGPYIPQSGLSKTRQLQGKIMTEIV